MELQIPVKFKAGNQVVPEEPRPRKDTNKYIEKLEKRPPDHKQSGTKVRWESPWVLFFNFVSSNSLSRHEAWCEAKPACKGYLSCQSYLCVASGFAAVDHDDKSTQLSNKLEGTKAHRLNDCPNTCARDFFLQSA